MYGEDRNIRLFVGLGLVILLMFVVIFLIINHGSDGGDKGKVAETKKELTSYVNDSDVTVTQSIVGPIRAIQNHNQMEINVTNSSVTANRINGYDGNVVGSLNYPMTNASFSEFLNALNRAGFTSGITDEKLQDDQGFCPTGNRYIYTVREGSKIVQRFWATSCGGTKTYEGNLSLTINLFHAQVPDYSNLMSGSGI